MTREEAIKILKTERYCQENVEGVKRVRKAYDMAIEALKQEPVKHGEWIKDKNSCPGVGLSNYLCDRCGKCGGTWLSDLEPHKFPKFCMWCGAKMTGGENK